MLNTLTAEHSRSWWASISMTVPPPRLDFHVPTSIQTHDVWYIAEC